MAVAVDEHLPRRPCARPSHGTRRAAAPGGGGAARRLAEAPHCECAPHDDAPEDQRTFRREAGVGPTGRQRRHLLGVHRAVLTQHGAIRTSQQHVPVLRTRARSKRSVDFGAATRSCVVCAPPPKKNGAADGGYARAKTMQCQEMARSLARTKARARYAHAPWAPRRSTVASLLSAEPPAPGRWGEWCHEAWRG